MENINSLVLISGIIALALYSMKVSHDTVMAAENMSKSVQMMFVKS